MKTLTLFRHAKSGWDAPVDRDFDRPINARGTKGARLIGKYLASKGWRFDYVISSPAVRCTETLDVLWEGYGEILHPNWDRRIYLASGATLLDVVQAPIPDEGEMFAGEQDRNHGAAPGVRAVRMILRIRDHPTHDSALRGCELLNAARGNG